MRGGKLPRWGALVAAVVIVIGSATPALAQPTITGFTPIHGLVGDPVTISGSGFTNAKDVSFGNISDPTAVVDDDSHISATVPAGTSTGPISVSTPDGTATSDTDFTVDTLPVAPVIDSFTPDHGPEHATVIITGSSFTGATLRPRLRRSLPPQRKGSLPGLSGVDLEAL